MTCHHWQQLDGAVPELECLPLMAKKRNVTDSFWMVFECANQQPQKQMTPTNHDHVTLVEMECVIDFPYSNLNSKMVWKRKNDERVLNESFLQKQQGQIEVDWIRLAVSSDLADFKNKTHAFELEIGILEKIAQDENCIVPIMTNE